MVFRGSLPALILQSLSKGPTHGYKIAQDIKLKSKGVLDFKEGTLYPALHGLENKGLVRSESKQQGGRTRRYYRLTGKGKRALVRKRKEWVAFSHAVTLILQEA